MGRRALLVLGLLLAGCSASSTTSTMPDAGAGSRGGSGGSGGSTGSGGSGRGGSGGGGTRASGGSEGTGGVVGSGGASAAGGSAGGQGGARSDAGRDALVRTDTGSGGQGGGFDDAGTGGSRPDAGVGPGQDVAADVASDARQDTLPASDAKPGATSDAATSDGAPCPHVGRVTYTLAKSANPTSTEQNAYDLITAAMDKAVYYYNCYTDITKSLNISYNAGVQTADGNINGSIRFGSTGSMVYITAMHEIGHTLGIGTASNWRSLVDIPQGGSSGPWTGTNGNAELRAITGKSTDTLTADTQHFWPYGLNYTSEVKSEADLINHCRIVVAMRKDLGM